MKESQRYKNHKSGEPPFDKMAIKVKIDKVRYMETSYDRKYQEQEHILDQKNLITIKVILKVEGFMKI